MRPQRDVQFDTKVAFVASAIPATVDHVRVRSVAGAFPPPSGQVATALTYRRGTATPSGLYGEALVGGVYWRPLYDRDPVDAGQFGVVGDAGYDDRATNFTGTTDGSTAIITTTSTSGVVNGMKIGGRGIPAGATVSRFIVNTSVTISTPTTIAATSLIAAWFGTVSGTDNTIPLQQAINFALQNNLQSVVLPQGKFKTTDTIHLGWGETFNTVTLSGPFRPAFVGQLAGAAIYPTATDRCAINIQGSRNSALRGIAIVGKNALWAQYAQGYPSVISAAESDWLAPDLVATGTNPGGLQTHSPYAGICIDAFSGAQPADHYPAVAYPAWTGLSTQYNKALGSNVTIEQVDISGFAVGLLSHPASEDQGDFVRIRNSDFTASVYGIAVCNSQSRNVEIRNINYAFLHTFLTGTRFGPGHAELNGPISNISGGAGYQIFDFSTLGYSGPLIIEHLYVETQVRIGRLIGTSAFPSNVRFVGGLLHLEDSLHKQIPAAYIETGGNANFVFDGTQFVTGNRIANLFAGGTPSVSLSNAQFINSQDPSAIGTVAKQTAINYSSGMLMGSSRYNSNGFNKASANNVLGSSYQTPTGAYGSELVSDTIQPFSPLLRAQMTQFGKYYRDQMGREWRMGVPPENLINLDTTTYVSVSPVLTGDQLTYTYKSVFQTNPDAMYNLSLGDLLFHLGTSTIFRIDRIGAVDGSGNYPVTATQQNNLNTNGINTFVSNNITAADLTNYVMIIKTGAVIPNQLEFGTFTAGSPNVATVSRGDGYGGNFTSYYTVGDLHFQSQYNADGWRQWPIASGSTLIAVTNGSPGSAVLSKNALYNGVFPIFPYPLW